MASSDHVVLAYRIVAPRWARSAFSGEGAQKFGGRWNSPGHRVVYTAGSRALAALEMLVHLTTPGSRKKPYCLIEVQIPKDRIADTVTVESPRHAGDEWIVAGETLALRVPSYLVPEEPNYVLNPSHPDFSNLRIQEPDPFEFDSRL